MNSLLEMARITSLSVELGEAKHFYSLYNLPQGHNSPSAYYGNCRLKGDDRRSQRIHLSRHDCIAYLKRMVNMFTFLALHIFMSYLVWGSLDSPLWGTDEICQGFISVCDAIGERIAPFLLLWHQEMEGAAVSQTRRQRKQQKTLPKSTKRAFVSLSERLPLIIWTL